MKLLYARLIGPAASFRYPFVATGRQPSYPLPPLSTIHGLLRAAWGDDFEDSKLRVGYLFHAEPETIDDIEKLWLLKRRVEASPDTHSNSRLMGRTTSPIEEMKSNVFRRELYVNIALELYLWAQEGLLEAWLSALRSPHFWLTLGRSQELVSVEEVQLISTCTGHTSPLYGGPGLYPLSWQPYLKGAYTTEKMPVYIPVHQRRPVFHGLFLQLLSPQLIYLPSGLNPETPPNFAVVPIKTAQRPKTASECRIVYLWPLGKTAIAKSREYLNA